MALGAGCASKGDNGASAPAASGAPEPRTQAPAAPNLRLPTSSPFLSAQDQLEIAGDCDAGNTVVLGLPDETQRTTPCTGGSFSFTVSSTTDGSTDYKVRQQAHGGPLSEARALTWVRAARAPDAPGLEGPAALLTRTSPVTVSGSCEPGHTVILEGADSQSSHCTASRFSFTLAQARDGSSGYVLTQRSPTDVVSSPTAFRWTLDTQAPSTPHLSEPVSSPFLSSDSFLRISGACEPGDRITVSGDLQASATCDQGFSVTLPKEVDGTVHLEVTETDPAGNGSQPLALTWIRDTALPPSPVVLQPASTPFASNATQLVISGQCVAGDTVRLAGATQETQACAQGTFRFETSPASDGTYAYVLQQRSPSGVDSAPVPVTWTRDTLRPAAPRILQPLANPTFSGGNSLDLSGACEAGARVELGGTDLPMRQNCTSGGFNFQVPKLTDGTLDLTLFQTDTAGNRSETTAFRWTRDTSTPTTPVIGFPGVSPFVSKDSSLVVSGSCTEGDQITLGGDDLQEARCLNAAFRFTLRKEVDGTGSYWVQQTHPFNGNRSEQAHLTWIRDTQAPPAPSRVTPTQDTETSAGPLVWSGSCEPSATLQLSGDSSQNAICPDSGIFSLTIQKELDGTYHFALQQTDAAGNPSDSQRLTWNRRTPPLAPPTVITPAASPVISNAETLQIAGTCLPGVEVSLNNTLAHTCDPAGAFSFQVSPPQDGWFAFTLVQSTPTRQSSPVTVLWNRDTTPPATWVVRQPEPVNRARKVVFEFLSTEPGSHFECQLDSDPRSACTSPFHIDSLDRGWHSFRVQARDAAGNLDPTPARVRWFQARKVGSRAPSEKSDLEERP